MSALKLGTISGGVSFELPENATIQKMAMMGRTGSGKTYGAGVLVEAMLAASMQVCILDPVGVWYGLRLAANGKSPGIKIPIFGGLHGDIAIEPTAGKLIADVICEKNISVVIDVSQFESDADKARFAADFGDRLYFRKKSSPSRIHLVIEECQEFIPQFPQKGEERMLHVFNRMWKIGRNFGIGGTLLSQRPQEVNKKALNQTECLFAFQATGTLERKAIEDWASVKGVGKGLADDLPTLEIGTCHVWSPQWLRVSAKMKFGKKWTFNSSSAPDQETELREPAPIDMKEIAEQMKATVQASKENDPKELKKELAAAKAELTAAQYALLTEAKTEYVNVLDDDSRAMLDAIKSDVDHVRSVFTTLTQIHLESVSARLAQIEGKISAGIKGTVMPRGKTTVPRPVKPVQPVQPPRVSDGAVIQSNPALTKAGRSILTALAQFGSCSKNKLAAIAGYAVNGGGFNNALGALRSSGWVVGSDPIDATASGMDALGSWERLPTGENLVRFWIAKSSKAEGMVLQVLMQVYPESLSKADIAIQTGYQATGGGFNNALGALRTLELITRGDPIKLNDNLFA